MDWFWGAVVSSAGTGDRSPLDTTTAASAGTQLGRHTMILIGELQHTT
jgi:hypothetical protein